MNGSRFGLPRLPVLEPILGDGVKLKFPNILPKPGRVIVVPTDIRPTKSSDKSTLKSNIGNNKSYSPVKSTSTAAPPAANCVIHSEPPAQYTNSGTRLLAGLTTSVRS